MCCFEIFIKLCVLIVMLCFVKKYVIDVFVGQVDITQGCGWAPICEFLERPIPLQPFPFVDGTAFIKRKVSAVLFMFIFNGSHIGCWRFGGGISADGWLASCFLGYPCSMLDLSNPVTTSRSRCPRRLIRRIDSIRQSGCRVPSVVCNIWAALIII